jgi:hypothetical protein
MKRNHFVRFEVLTALNKKIIVFWDMMSCHLQRDIFGGTCCLHLQDRTESMQENKGHIWKGTGASNRPETVAPKGGGGKCSRGKEARKNVLRRK